MPKRMPASRRAAYFEEYRALNRDQLRIVARERYWQRVAADPTYRAQVAARKRARYETDQDFRAKTLARNRQDAARRRSAQRAVCESSDHTLLPRAAGGHPLLEEARRLAGPVWHTARLYWPLREDAAGEAVLAMLEQRDPVAAIRRYLASERAYRALTVPLLSWKEG